MTPTSAPSTSPADAQTHCPTCGAKKTRPDSTLCAYCATPFGLVGGTTQQGGDDPTRARLAKMADHKDYAEALKWIPLEGDEHHRAELARKGGIRMVAVSALLFAAAVVQGWIWLHGLGAVVLVIGVVRFVRGNARMAQIVRMPLLKRPALVLDRRSETAMGWWEGTTVYYFLLVFEDGSEGEFRWPGRGIEHEPLVNGGTGLAFTRGDTLLGFRTIRV